MSAAEAPGALVAAGEACPRAGLCLGSRTWGPSALLCRLVSGISFFPFSQPQESASVSSPLTSPLLLQKPGMRLLPSSSSSVAQPGPETHRSCLMVLLRLVLLGSAHLLSVLSAKSPISDKSLIFVNYHNHSASYLIPVSSCSPDQKRKK